MLLLLVVVLLPMVLKPLEGAIDQQKFKQMLFPASVWPPYIHTTVPALVKTRVECGSYCLTNTVCHGFAFKDSNCWLADLQRSSNIIGTQPEHLVYIDIVYLTSQMTSLTSVVTLTTSTWQETTYYTRSIDGPANHLDCINECLNVNRMTCESAVFDYPNCYLGQLSKTDGSITNPPTGNVTMYIVNSPLTLRLSSVMSTKDTVLGAKWSAYIFKQDPEPTTEEQCGGICLLDKTTPCHYYVFDGTTCYLGNFETTVSIISPRDDDRTINIYTANLVDFLPTEFVPESGNLYRPFIKREYTGATGDDHCMVHCKLDSNDDCHFSVYISSYSKCLIGNFDVTSPISTTDMGTVTAQIFVPQTTDQLYFDVTMTNMIWPPMMSRTKSDVASQQVCSAYCTLIGTPCQLYKYFADTKLCHLGEYTTNTNVVATSSTGSEVVQVRDAHFRPYGAGIFTASLSGVGGSDWSKRIYRTVTMTGPSSLPDAHAECNAYCHYDTNPCRMFVLDHPNCYLGDPTYDLTVVTSGLTKTTYGNYDALWGNWDAWSGCSHTCGNDAKRIRYHTCDSPPMIYGGRNCTGSHYELTNCVSPPGACSWTYSNAFDGAMDWACSKPDEAINYVYHYHDNGKEDRRYGFRCGQVHRFAPASSCSWTGYVNSFDLVMDYTCPLHSVIAGFNSYHDSFYEDRRFKVKCCYFPNKCLTSCGWTGYVNAYDGVGSYTAPSEYFIRGAYSIHGAGAQDRRWKYLQCRVYDC